MNIVNKFIRMNLLNGSTTFNVVKSIASQMTQLATRKM